MLIFRLFNKPAYIHSVKNVMLTVFWHMHGSITTNFLKKNDNCIKKFFELPTPLAKFILFIE